MKKNVAVYRKGRLIQEVAKRCGITQATARQVFDVLADIVTRESAQAQVALPGLCKFALVRRHARKIRNPRTGEKLLLPPQDALKVSPAPALKRALAPKVAAVPITDEPETPAISFRCPSCGQEIEAPGDIAGLEAECPMCGRIVTVPKTSELGTIYGPAAGGDGAVNREVVSADEAEEMDPALLKNRTIRIDIPDDF